ncbi:hypothetical protein [Pseudomonas cremoricolorata]|uniref:Uncharacterized protein n=1 Tax=Pseudomonas cremoricolorata TaxID=157783 RepID=A0A089YCI8_9PSED|nr:hypothetical protein [Pseudomonas cremoricolorata]AIR89508.1 hypothetical protein LK03_09530 [Pseudomonas cremoricolorata]
MTDDPRDYLDLSDIPEHQQDLRLLQHKASWRLDEKLNEVGVTTPAAQIFLNSHDGNGLVIDSASLIDLVVNAVQHGDLPSPSEDYSGLFYVQSSFDDAHRVGDELLLDQAMDVVGQVHAQLQG